MIESEHKRLAVTL